MALTESLYGRKVQVGMRPVVLVGHSLGGLVLKQVCRELDKRSHGNDSDQRRKAGGFLNNIQGLVFYATPHGGSKLADLAQTTASFIPSFFVRPGPVVAYLAVLSTTVGRLNQDFQSLRESRNWKTLAFYEQHATQKGPQFLGFGFNALVVEQASATQGMGRIVPINKDHLQICKPNGENAPAYSHLHDFLEEHLLGA